MRTSSAPHERTPPSTPPAAAPGPTAPWLTLGAFCVLFGVCALPILATRVPPLLDYPGHLSRIYVITHPNDGFLAQYFSVGWKITPMLAVDLIIPTFMRFASIFDAGRAFILLTILLMASGTLALHYVLYRAWIGPALCFLFVFNGVFWDGLLPYLFAIGVALWATVGWIALRRRPWLVRVVFSVCAVAVLFLSHLAGVGLYLLAIVSYEVANVRAWTWRPLAFEAAVLFAPLLVVLPLLAASPTSHDLSGIVWGPLSAKWIGPYLAVRSADLMLDGIVVGIVAVLLACLIATRRLEVPRVARTFLVLSIVAYLVVPTEFFDGSEIDIRLPAAFVFFAIGLVHWRISSPRAGLAYHALIAALLAVRVAGVAQAWQTYSGMLAEYEASFAQVTAGSRVLVAADLSPAWRGSGNRVTIGMDRDAIGHLPDLAAIERSCLVSEVFADPGNRVYRDVEFRAPYRDALPSREVPSVQRLQAMLPSDAAAASASAAADPALVDEPLRDWPAHYDYLYVQYATPSSHLQIPDVTLLYQGSSFQLYRIQHSAT